MIHSSEWSFFCLRFPSVFKHFFWLTHPEEGGLSQSCMSEINNLSLVGSICASNPCEAKVQAWKIRLLWFSALAWWHLWWPTLDSRVLSHFLTLLETLLCYVASSEFSCPMTFIIPSQFINKYCSLFSNNLSLLKQLLTVTQNYKSWSGAKPSVGNWSSVENLNAILSKSQSCSWLLHHWFCKAKSMCFFWSFSNKGSKGMCPLHQKSSRVQVHFSACLVL